MSSRTRGSTPISASMPGQGTMGPNMALNVLKDWGKESRHPSGAINVNSLTTSVRLNAKAVPVKPGQ